MTGYFVFFRGRIKKIEITWGDDSENMAAEYIRKLIEEHDLTDNDDLPIVVRGTECEISVREFKVVKEVYVDLG